MTTVVGVQVSSLAPRRSKVRFAPASFLSLDKKDAIRPLPCSSFPNRNRNRWVAIWVMANGTHAFTFSMPVQSPLCSGVFLSLDKKDAIRPLPCSSFPNRNRNRWVAIWVTANGPPAFAFFPCRCKVRFAPACFMPGTIHPDQIIWPVSPGSCYVFPVLAEIISRETSVVFVHPFRLPRWGGKRVSRFFLRSKKRTEGRLSI